LEERQRRRQKATLTEYARAIEIPGVPLNEDDPACETFYADTVTPAPHHDLLLEHLQRVAAGEIKRLMIFWPPGTAKTTYASVVFPTFYMGLKPRSNVIQASYGSDLALKLGRKCRSITRSATFKRLYGCELVADNRAADDWSLTNGSTYMAGGILSGITGNRADLLIIDDPIKGREEADSKTIRDKTWEAYKSDLRTRMKPNGCQVLIQTRWHSDDLAGRILPADYAGESGWVESQLGEPWFVLCLPAQADRDDDPLGREVGEWLWPDWFTPEHWETEKRAQGSRNWAALYQQKPTIDGGEILRSEWWQPWTEPLPSPDYVVISLDTAYTAKDEGDASACCVWWVCTGKDNRSIALLRYAWAKRLEFPELVDEVQETVRYFGGGMICRVLIEAKASGISVAQELRRRLPEQSVWEVQPKGDKIARAYAVQPMFEAERVWHAAQEDGSPKAWALDVIDECAAFPRGAHDDRVDAVTMGLRHIRNQGVVLLPEDDPPPIPLREVLKQSNTRSPYGSIGVR
jgi:predicted phage terminase large subunit-like protein